MWSVPRVAMWIVAGAVCASTGCHDSGGTPSADAAVGAGALRAPETGILGTSPAIPLCTLNVGTGPALDGQCVAGWHATDAGSVTNFVHFEVAMSGISGVAWSANIDGTLADPEGGYTVDIAVGAQTSHAAGPALTQEDSPAGTGQWQGSGGVVLYLTAHSEEDYAEGHFVMIGVHGSFDMAQPFAVHAQF